MKLLLALAAVATIGLAGCGDKSRENPSVVAKSDDPASLVRQQFEALNRNDIRAYMATIDPTSPAYQSTEKAMTLLATKYKLTYTLDTVKVLSNTGNEAKIEFTQTTKKVSGPEFRDNKLTSVATERMIGGKWLMTDTAVKHLDFLN